MHTSYDAIYLSPHLDDVALSCGGQIFQQTAAGKRVLIVTITAGDPPAAAISTYAQSLHNRWELVTHAVAARRAEDLAACQILGADALHWSVPDCIYRYHSDTGAALYLSDPDIFGNLHEVEQPLVAELSRQMTALPTAEQILAPLVIGHHVDHQLTRSAAEHAFGVTRLTYYEDYPYAQKPGALATVISPEAVGWHSTVISISAAGLKARFDAISAFESQLSTFFKDRTDLERQVGDFVRQVGGEQLWRYQ